MVYLFSYASADPSHIAQRSGEKKTYVSFLPTLSQAFNVHYLI